MSNFHVTPEMMETMYEYLRLTPPFKGWKLPDPDELSFKVITSGQIHGECGENKDHIYISISITNVYTSNDLMKTMAHEMIHVEEWRRKINEDHGKFFNRAARRACAWHGWLERGF